MSQGNVGRDHHMISRAGQSIGVGGIGIIPVFRIIPLVVAIGSGPGNGWMEFEHRAGSGRAARVGRAEEIAGAVRDQAAQGTARVDAVEGGKGGDAAAAGRYLKHRAIAGRAATVGCAEEIAAAVLDQAAYGGLSGGAVEGGKGGDAATAGLYLEHRARIGRAATVGCAEEVAAGVLDQAAVGPAPVG